jgi:hypothetical protein
MITLTGILLCALGLLAAALLLASPLEISAGIDAGTVLWVLFPLFTGVGWMLLVMGSRDRAVRMPTQWLAGALLLMAVVAAGALTLAAANIVALRGSTAAWWYVLVIAGSIGVVGIAAYGRRAGD